MATKIDYDLNIFRQEVEVPDQRLVDPSEGTVWEYSDPWYLHIYVVDGAGHKEASEAYELTAEESKALALGTGYFEDDDCWYGLEGFLKDYEHQISDRLWSIFNALPVYKED